MSLNQIEAAKLAFRQEGPSELLSNISEEEKLSPESHELLIDIGAGILTKIVEDACFSAKSRGSDTVELSDIQFVSYPWMNHDQNETKSQNEEEIFYNKNEGSPEHRSVLEMINRFKEMNEKDSNH